MNNKTKNSNFHNFRQKAQRLIYVVGPSSGYANWMQGILTNDMKSADLVVFTGGEDISPDLYNQPPHFTTGPNPYRDAYELKEYNRALKLKKPMIGICRGHQFLCAMAGGILIQDQENPRVYHPMTTEDGKTLIITSLHHQAAYPWGMPKEDYKVIAWADESEYHKGGNDEELTPEDGKEVEIIYFPKIKAYGVQGHPEMMVNSSYPECEETLAYLRNQLDLFIAGKL